MKQIINLSSLFIAAMVCCLYACNSGNNTSPVADTTGSTQQINAMLDSFNIAAAKADYSGYFNFYTEDAIFTGTDATERWDKKEFMQWAKPIFDKGRAWDFTSLERHIYFDKTGSLAWFDELLNTQMKICRGSGVVVKQGSDWKVQQYILSTMLPNDLLDTVIKLKTPAEDSIINKLLQQ
jgi:hypothetical protein